MYWLENSVEYHKHLALPVHETLYVHGTGTWWAAHHLVNSCCAVAGSEGTFSEIYEASDLRQERGADGRHPHVAVKVAREGQKRSMLLHEEEVLRALQPCSSVARFVEIGRDASCHYLVMPQDRLPVLFISRHGFTSRLLQ